MPEIHERNCEGVFVACLQMPEGLELNVSLKRF